MANGRGLVETVKDAAANATAAAKEMLAGAPPNAATGGDAQKRTKSDILRDAYENAKLNQVASFGALPGDASLRLRLSNGSEFHEGALKVSRDDFKPERGDHATYAKAIDIGPDGPLTEVSEVWVQAKNGDAVCCLLGRLVGGGGHHAQIPADNLIF